MEKFIKSVWPEPSILFAFFNPFLYPLYLNILAYWWAFPSLNFFSLLHFWVEPNIAHI